jgi:hypothetical protein
LFAYFFFKADKDRVLNIICIVLLDLPRKKGMINNVKYYINILFINLVFITLYFYMLKTFLRIIVKYNLLPLLYIPDHVLFQYPIHNSD